MTQEGAVGQHKLVIAGRLTQDYILPISGKPQINILGGNLAYAAAGLKLWGGTGGLLARVSKDYPLDWLEQFKTYGFDLSGIRAATEKFESRQFYAHIDPITTHTNDPVQHFAGRGLAFPPELLGYRSGKEKANEHTNTEDLTIQISDVPKHYLEASAVHICPIDSTSHLFLPSLFRQGLASTVTLTSDPTYMDPSYWEEIPGLLSEITAFHTEETEIRRLFQGRMADLWEMAAILADYGPEYVLVRTQAEGYYLYDRVSQKRWVIPSYQTTIIDPTGRRDAFAGAFLLGYRQNYDPIKGALMGSLADSMVQEGSGVFYGLDALPGLLDKRLGVLRELVTEV